MSRLEVVGIRKSYQDLTVLADINLSLGEGQFASILGISGSGKSTLFHVIAGLEKPDAGQVLLSGKDVTGQAGQIGYMQQEDLLLPWLSVEDNAGLPLRLRGVSRSEARNEARKLMPLFGLEGFEQSYPHQLSGGMRQRAALLRTHLFGADVILLDEPFARLDALTRDKMRGWFKAMLAHMAASALLITHDVDEAIALSDRIYVLTDKPAQICAELGLPCNEEEKQAQAPRIKNEILALLG